MRASGPVRGMAARRALLLLLIAAATGAVAVGGGSSSCQLFYNATTVGVPGVQVVQLHAVSRCVFCNATTVGVPGVQCWKWDLSKLPAHTWVGQGRGSNNGDCTADPYRGNCSRWVRGPVDHRRRFRFKGLLLRVASPSLIHRPLPRHAARPRRSRPAARGAPCRVPPPTRSRTAPGAAWRSVGSATAHSGRMAQRLTAGRGCTSSTYTRISVCIHLCIDMYINPCRHASTSAPRWVSTGASTCI